MSELPIERRTYTPDTFAQTLGVGRTTVYALIREGRIRSFKVGRRRLIHTEEMDRFLAEA
jgi:excisionase family DNA binding protein